MNTPQLKKITFAFVLSLLTLSALTTWAARPIRDDDPKGVEVHLDKPVECTYHFINIGPDDYVLLDVIRSDQGNSVRFFHIQKGTLVGSLVRGEKAPLEIFRLAPTGDRLLGTSVELSFDVRFRVLKSASPYPPEIGESFTTLVAQDHPASEYSGWIRFRGQVFKILDGSAGSISQHFGTAFPPYAYFNTFKTAAEDSHYVGAIVQSETLGKKFLAGYVVKSQGKKLKRYDLANAKLDFSSLKQDQTQWEFEVTPHFSSKAKIHLRFLAPQTKANKLDHEIDGAVTTSYFGSQIQSLLDGGQYSGILEYRDLQNLLGTQP